MTFASSAVTERAVEQLLAMLRYKRPFATSGEFGFIKRFIDPYDPQVIASNRVIVVPKPDGSHSSTLFSCHTDTVHWKPGKQQVLHDADLGLIYKDDGEPLGADDGAGVFILLHMVQNAVPGTYVFHTGEERGGIGSALMADTEPGFIKRFERAIAFDRKGTEDVITHQSVGRCCSNLFAEALAAALNKVDASFSYAPSSLGLFTDTANYVDLIGECTNLSCGYEGEHTSGEMLDLGHLKQLAEAACKVDWDALPSARKAGERDEEDYFGWKGMRRWGKTSQRPIGSVPRALTFKGVYKGGSPAKRTEVFDDKTGTRHIVEIDERADEWDREQVDQYERAEDAARELFGALYENGLNRAYSSITYNEAVDFYIESPKYFEDLLDYIERGIYGRGDDGDVMAWVRGY